MYISGTRADSNTHTVQTLVDKHMAKKRNTCTSIKIQPTQTEKDAQIMRKVCRSPSYLFERLTECLFSSVCLTFPLPFTQRSRHKYLSCCVYKILKANQVPHNNASFVSLQLDSSVSVWKNESESERIVLPI